MTNIAEKSTKREGKKQSSRIVESMKATCPLRERLKTMGQRDPLGNHQIKFSWASHSYRVVVAVLQMVCLAKTDDSPHALVFLIIDIFPKRN